MPVYDADAVPFIPPKIWGSRPAVMSDVQIAERLSRLHKNQASCRPLSTGKIMHNLVGVAGERQFSIEFDLFFDEERACTRPEGDDGWDFWVLEGTDVKTAQKPGNLLVEEGKVKCAIYVLAGFEGDLDQYHITFYGWATAAEVLEKVPELWPMMIVNHIIPRRDLRPMSKLHELIDAVRPVPRPEPQKSHLTKPEKKGQLPLFGG